MLGSVLFTMALLAAPPVHAAAAKAYYIPPVPAFIEVSTAGAHGSAFCSSPELRKFLNSRFFHYAAEHESLHADLVINCSSNDQKVHFTVDDASGVRVSALETKLDPHNFEATAYVSAHKLATDRKTLKAALVAYDRDLRFAYLKPGTDAFAAKDWKKAAYMFHRLLETGTPTTILYFGLYASHAKLGHVELAKWYLRAYCESEKKDVSRLTKEQLAYLQDMPAEAAPEPYDAAKLTRDRDGKKWSWLLSDLQDKLAAEPWDLKAYYDLAEAYQRIGWDQLADQWRKRETLARKVAGDNRLRRDVARLVPKR